MNQKKRLAEADGEAATVDGLAVLTLRGEANLRPIALCYEIRNTTGAGNRDAVPSGNVIECRNKVPAEGRGNLTAARPDKAMERMHGWKQRRAHWNANR